MNNNTDTRLVTYKGVELLVRSVEFRSDVVVRAVPVFEAKTDRSGRVAQLVYATESETVRLVNPKIERVNTHDLSTDRVRKMIAGGRKLGLTPGFAPEVVAEAASHVRKAVDTPEVRCIQVAAELGLSWSDATDAERATIRELAGA